MKTTVFAVMALAIAVAGSAGEKTKGKANGKRAGSAPLAKLPSAPGAHVSRIKALGNNKWLKLGKPQPDPKYGLAPGRAYTNKMAPAPELGGAFLMGEGVHGGAMMRGGRLHYNDDVWFYDARAHRWICVYPGTDVRNFECKMDKNGFEVDVKTGQHPPIAIAVHGYECFTYIAAANKFMCLESGSSFWQKRLEPRRSKWRGKPSWTARKEITKNPFFYDVKTGRWQRVKSEKRAPVPGLCKSLIYMPEFKKVALYGRHGDFWFYDYAANKWSHVNGKGPAPSCGDYEGVSCYDGKRGRVYAFNRNRNKPGSFGIYEVKTNTWIKPNSKVRPDVLAGSHYSSTTASAHYDAAGDAVVLFLRGGRKAKAPGVYVYDVEKDEWTPKRTSPRTGGQHGYYDPGLNVHVFFNAGDSNTRPGEINLYRYKRR